MRNKQQHQQDLERFLSESNVAGQDGYGNHSHYHGGENDGTWITSQEQFDEIYKSVDNFEKFLRS